MVDTRERNSVRGKGINCTRGEGTREDRQMKEGGREGEREEEQHDGKGKGNKCKKGNEALHGKVKLTQNKKKRETTEITQHYTLKTEIKYMARMKPVMEMGLWDGNGDG